MFKACLGMIKSLPPTLNENQNVSMLCLAGLLILGAAVSSIVRQPGC